MDISLQRIVVGVDGSAGSRAALVWAFSAAAERSAVLEVLSAFPVDFYWTDPYLLDAQRIDTLRADTEARARELVDEVRLDPAVAAVPGAADVPVEVTVAPGPAPEHLLHRAEVADLLVVGSRGRGTVRSTLLGSVALHCAAHAACPVVVVHPAAPGTAGRAPTGAVLVGVDRSAAAAAALRAAAAEAVRSGAPLRVVSAYEGTNYWSDLYAVMAPPAGQTREQARGTTEGIVAEVLAGMPERDRPVVDVVVEEGAPAEVLLSQAEGARLLVVGSRGRSRLAGMLLGSVALSCVIHSPCPVMVVRAPRRAAEAPLAAEAASAPVAG